MKFQLFEEEMVNPLSGHEMSELERYVASLLLDASSAQPIGIQTIILRVNLSTGHMLSERKVKGIIRTLRKSHKFPILASRTPPTGYWWCSGIEEMERFIESFRSQALDELHTLSQIVKHNFPALAGQLKFEETL